MVGGSGMKSERDVGKTGALNILQINYDFFIPSKILNIFLPNTVLSGLAPEIKTEIKTKSVPW